MKKLDISTQNARDIIESSLKTKKFYDSLIGMSYRIIDIYTSERNQIYTRIAYEDGRLCEGVPLARHLSAELDNSPSLGSLNFPARIRTALYLNYRAKTLNDLCDLTEKEIMSARCIGPKSLQWIVDFLGKQGLSLKK